MVIFIGDDALQASGTDKASMIDIRTGITVALGRNVIGCAKDIELIRPSLLLFVVCCLE